MICLNRLFFDHCLSSSTEEIDITTSIPIAYGGTTPPTDKNIAAMVVIPVDAENDFTVEDEYLNDKNITDHKAIITNRPNMLPVTELLYTIKSNGVVAVVGYSNGIIIYGTRSYLNLFLGVST